MQCKQYSYIILPFFSPKNLNPHVQTFLATPQQRPQLLQSFSHFFSFMAAIIICFCFKAPTHWVFFFVLKHPPIRSHTLLKKNKKTYTQWVNKKTTKAQ